MNYISQLNPFNTFKLNEFGAYDFIKFPKPETWGEYIYGPGVVFMNEGGVLEKIRKWSTAYGDDYLKGYAKEVLGNRYDEVEIKELIGHYTVSSIANEFQLKVMMGAIDRVLHLITMSLQVRLMGKSEYSVGVRILGSLLLMTVPYVGMGLLGYEGWNLFFVDVFQFFSCYIMGLRYGNLFRGLELISSQSGFDIKDFGLRNTVHMAKNYIGGKLSYTFLDNVFNKYGRIDFKYIFRDGAGIEYFIDKWDGAKVYRAYALGGVGVDMLYILGVGIGKMLVDLVLVVLKWVGVVKDLRDPINSIFYEDRELGEEEGRERRETRRMIEIDDARKSRREKARKETKVKTEVDKVHRRAETVHIGDVETLVETVVGTKGKKEKTRGNKGKANVEESPVTVVAKKALNRRKVITMGLMGNDLSPLSGGKIHGNVWGVITDDNVKDFQTSLNSGNVGNDHSAIKYIGKDSGGNCYYEIRPRNNENRLVGIMWTYDEAQLNDFLGRLYGHQEVANRGLAAELLSYSGGEREVKIVAFCERMTHEQIKALNLK